MGFELLRAPVGAGKTRAVIDRIKAAYAADPLERVWVVLPTARQEYALRQRLIEEGEGRAPLFNLELFNFYSLYERILLAAKTPTYQVRGMARTLLLRHVIETTLSGRADSPFAPIAKTLGLAQLVADFIDELKSARVQPHHFAAVAQTAKDRDLAAIYAAYQAVLRRETGQVGETPLVDTEGEGWLALEVLAERAPHLDLGLLVVDGFDQFTQVQVDLIHALSSHATDTLVTLSVMPERVGGRVAQAERLMMSGALADSIRVTTLPARPFESPTLEHLVAQAFREGGEQRALTDDALTFIEGATPFTEAREVMRAVKRRLVTTDARPDEMVIAVRDWATYGTALSAAAELFGVPLAVHRGLPLLEHPFGAFFDGLLRLSEENFPRREVLDVWYSPYVMLDAQEDLPAPLLEQISLRAGVLSGTDEWSAAIALAAQPQFDDYHGEIAPLIDAAVVDGLQQHLGEFFTRMTLPPQATLNHYVQTIEEWLGNDVEDESAPDDSAAVKMTFSLNIIRAVRALPDDERTRDLDAVRALKTALRQLLNAHEVVRWATGLADPLVLRETFITDLRAAMAATQLREATGRAGRVLLTLVNDARGLPHRHVVMMGLSEGLFPSKTSDDPLYLDVERAELSQRLSERFGYAHALRTRAERSGDDSVFFELMGLPRRSLTLSRPYIQNGATWPVSYLWRAVETVFDAIPPERKIRARPGGVPSADDAITPSELALALVHVPDAPFAPELTAYLQATQPDAVRHLQAAYAVQADRLRLEQAWDEYSGSLADSAWAAEIDRHYQGYPWSVSALEAFGASPYRFFVQRLLKLEEWQAPDDELDVADTGTVLHGLFNHLYTAFIQANLPIGADHTEAVLGLTDSLLPELLDHAPEEYRFGDSAMWRLQRQNLARRVRTLIERDYLGQNPIVAAFPSLIGVTRWPLLREWKFGDDARRVRIALPDGSSIAMRGTFDRVDVAQVGGELVWVVMDYKSGSTPYSKDDFSEGRKVQMPLYIRVLETLLAEGVLDDVVRARGLDPALPKRVLGGLYWGVAGKYESLFTVKADDAEVMETTLAHVANFVRQIRAAQFFPYASKPNKGKCFAYCAFHGLCRVCDMQLEKATPSTAS